MKAWQYYDPTFDYETIFSDIEWPWAGHKRFAYDFVRNIKPKVIVELGTHKGTSLFSMCQAIKDGGLKSSITAVDIWVGDPHAGFYDESIYTEVQKIASTYYKSLDIHLLRKTFDDATSDFNKSSIDLLHIDGMHTYEAVKHDFESWISKVKPKGTIFFNDTHEKKDDFGVYQLWEELKTRYMNVEFCHSHGLGVILLDPNKEKIIDFQTIWQKYYDIFFRLDQYKTETNTLTKQIESQAQQIELRDKIVTTQDQIGRLEADLNKIKSTKFFKLWQLYNKCKLFRKSNA